MLATPLEAADYTRLSTPEEMATRESLAEVIRRLSSEYDKPIVAVLYSHSHYVHGTTALVAAYGWAARVNAAVTWAWVASMPFTHLALLAQPQLLHYGGLSGVLHGGVAAVSVWLAVRGNGGERTVGWLMLIGQAVKLLLERSWDAALQTPPELDVAVAPLAHASGSLAGALLTLLALRLTRTAQRRR